jgi:putative membrane protein
MIRRWTILAALATALSACTADERVENAGAAARAGTGTDSAMGLIDTAPVAVGQAVAARLSGGNVFALLDTTYAALGQLETLAAQHASDTRVRDFAAGSQTQLETQRRAALATRDRLNITAELPDRDPLEEHAEAMRALEGKRGADFDRAYLEHSIDIHEELLDEVDDAMQGSDLDAAVRTFLEQERRNLEAHLERARELRGQIGG